MKTLRFPLALSCALAALVGCPAPTVAPSTAPTTASSVKPGTPAIAAKASLEGLVTAPAGLVAAGAGNLVAAGAGNLVAAGAGNYALLQAKGAPLVGAEVVVTDGLGVPLPGVARVKTGKDGRYKLVGVPAEGTFAVHVGFKSEDGKQASTLVALAAGGGGTADVTASTTCVAIGLLGEKGRALKGFDGDVYREAVGKIDEAAATDAPPPLWDRARIVSWMGKLEAKIDGLGVLMGKLDSRLDSIEAKLDELLKLGQTPAPTTAPTGVPSGEPTAGPTGGPTATPSAAATATPLPTPTPAPGATGSKLIAMTPLLGLAAPDPFSMGLNRNLMLATPEGKAWVAVSDGVLLLDSTGKVEVSARFGNNLQPRGLALDGYGNLWIADAYNGCAVRVTPKGQVGRTAPAGYGTPVDVAAGLDGTVWLASADRRIVEYLPSGEKSRDITPRDAMPVAIAYDPVDFNGSLWVSYGAPINKVTRLNGDGKIDKDIPLEAPTGPLRFDGDGALWVGTPFSTARLTADAEPSALGIISRFYAPDDQGRLWTVDAESRLSAWTIVGEAEASIPLGEQPQAIATYKGGKCLVLLNGTLTSYPK